MNSSLSFQHALSQGLENHYYQVAELVVAKHGQIISHDVIGDVPKKVPYFFDLASLTKVFSTTLLMMIAEQEKVLTVEQKLNDFFPAAHLAGVSLRELLHHTSGLQDWFDFSVLTTTSNSSVTSLGDTRKKIITHILTDPSLFDPTRHTTVYSDLGYILLGAVLEHVYQQSLDQLFVEKVAKPLGLEPDVFYMPCAREKKYAADHFVPSENSASRQRVLVGEVMDHNCYLMGGVSGHAGLFGHALGLHRILDELRLARLGASKIFCQDVVARYVLISPRRQVAERYFTLGFDTPTKPKSQSGRLFSLQTVGHLGYTGTSFWWDLQKDFWVILLTNRCYPHGGHRGFSDFRPRLHNTIVKTLRDL